VGKSQWGRERCGEEEVAEWGCYGLTVTPLPHPLYHSEAGELGMKE